jgi:hypothetical protein
MIREMRDRRTGFERFVLRGMAFNLVFIKKSVFEIRVQKKFQNREIGNNIVNTKKNMGKFLSSGRIQ